jgi:hypothetical protein
MIDYTHPAIVAYRARYAEFERRSAIWRNINDMTPGPSGEWLALVAAVRPALSAGLPAGEISGGALLAAGFSVVIDSRTGKPRIA